jgi:hypothetical protein
LVEKKKKEKKMRGDEYSGDNGMKDGREKRGKKPNRAPRPVSDGCNGKLIFNDIWSNVFF